ncbi:MAG: PTS sugar transporter subunit IIA [Mesorhizobium sp.]|uniref:PTS sugar transporter subunit IIA n=3 Tax=Mesorhizobium TaxID=68287 RepID=UPI000F75A308|nr:MULTISPECIES: PTS sugar transporter subunit IIA [unclassified Mesorhizobium]TGV92534.1 PTS sugar transporter subunit IIA [Mesorhizobium sp. M00.F.Ca.ET.158.01.1.1]AZO58708.1 PTS sugar transporter subunit IIA [Mesorhizobium sp. M1A.F.Ca.IN.022.06.1.1]MCT2578813.1 PTS sugar transporter subunit IIA [Mesorhizobium sp. P13.3]MDF3167752.1 PTS sugar transporter subunit IIA [Mesorhizobium sp. P16.1]MDF3178363.1 PTS sugar transporter subunit IIA [Mesorhizobium sp. P17.1]
MISPILSEEDISLDLVTKGKQSALSKIAIRIARRSGLDEKVVLRGLFDRERLASTGIGRGVAIPHALLENICSPVASLTRLAPPVDFDGPDDDPVDLVYTILWPRSASSAFLPALSRICRLLRASQVRERLRLAQSADEALTVLETQLLPSSTNSHISPDQMLRQRTDSFRVPTKPTGAVTITATPASIAETVNITTVAFAMAILGQTSLFLCP